MKSAARNCNWRSATATARPLVELIRADVRPEDEAGGILRQIETIGRGLIDRYRPAAVGIGFGGPVDAEEGRTIASHQVEGWADFALAAWCRETFGLPAAVANDADAAGLAEALFGAGRGHRVVFYITVGSGIGGALVIDGRDYGGGCGIASEIGHLRPGLDADDPRDTVESHASGFGLAAAGRKWLQSKPNAQARPGDALPGAAADLLTRCNGRIEQLTGRMVIEAAAAGNQAAQGIFAPRGADARLGGRADDPLVAPQVIVIGGGVSLTGEAMFFAPLRRETARYVFPPLAHSYAIVPAALGEEVVLHGALAIARQL